MWWFNPRVELFHRLLDRAKAETEVEMFLTGAALKKPDGTFNLNFDAFEPMNLNNNRDGWNKKMLSKATPKDERKKEDKKEEDMDIEGLVPPPDNEDDEQMDDVAEDMPQTVEDAQAKIKLLQAQATGNIKAMTPMQAAEFISKAFRTWKQEVAMDTIRKKTRYETFVKVIKAKPSLKATLWSGLNSTQLQAMIDLVEWNEKDPEELAELNKYQAKIQKLKDQEEHDAEMVDLE